MQGKWRRGRDPPRASSKWLKTGLSRFCVGAMRTSVVYQVPADLQVSAVPTAKRRQTKSAGNMKVGFVNVPEVRLP